MKNESENKSFLQEITQPPLRSSTSPNTVCLAKMTKTPIKDK